jgi:hypothetical protein
MNTIVDLLKYRNDLINQLEFLTVKLDINEPFSSLSNLNTKHSDISFSVDHIINSVTALQEVIQEKNISFINDVAKLIKDVEDQIDTIGQGVGYKDDVDVLGQNLIGEDYMRIKNTDLSPPNSVESKIRSYSSWYYPGLLISPLNKSWIDTMTACDPLYLIRLYYDSYLETIISDYPTEYQRRLRLHKNFHHQNFSLLPNNQFGFILAWNVLTEISIPSIEKYLTLIINLLRPGGVIMFNYNECDRLELAEASEKNAVPYCNHRMLKKVCEKIGYNIIQFGEHKSENIDNHFNWVELSKPGKLTTVKKSQALGKILPK